MTVRPDHTSTIQPGSIRAGSVPRLPALMASALTPVQLARDLGLADLTDPADGPHAMQLIASQAVTALTAAWAAPDGTGCEVRWCRGTRIVSVADNYDALGYASADITRAARYTRYVDDARMLRSHTTALIPPALRQVAADRPADVLLACPGVTYRRDSIDRLHTGTPHQLDLWRLSRRRLGTADLDIMIAALLTAVLPGRASRSIPRRHPYTRAGRQLDVRDGRSWVEVGECGLAHPRILAAAGLTGYSGLAVGLGLDRLLMLAKGIPDIRLLRSTDPRVTGQLQDLSAYRPVSSRPAVRRDVSVAVAGPQDDQTIGDRVREALGPDADAAEDVRVLSRTEADDLPELALVRLGLRPGQQNLLIRVVLRRLDRTLTDHEANLLRDRIYLAVHEGSRRELTAPAG